MHKVRSFLLLLCLLTAAGRSFADEGMWLPYFLGKGVYDDMVKKGLKLTREQIYRINGASLKDAIVLFDGGCTGGIISRDGLMITNYHCGYEYINRISRGPNNYLKNGFNASDRQAEVPISGTSVQFLVRVEDVTRNVEDSLKTVGDDQKADRRQAVIEAIQRKSVAGTVYEAVVLPMFSENQYLLFVYKRFTDIRLVCAPAESIGFFGGISDNWEWPRQSCDFAIFRIYGTKSGMPADYSADNAPIPCGNPLPISTKGVKEGDFTMIMGYPGNSDRYDVSYALKLREDIEDPSIVRLRDLRMRYMYDRMIKDSVVREKLTPTYAGTMNYRKFYYDEAELLTGDHLVQAFHKQEDTFRVWADDKPVYKDILHDFEKTYADWTPYARHNIYLFEAVMGPSLIGAASRLRQLADLLQSPGLSLEVTRGAMQMADEARRAFLDGEDVKSDLLGIAATCRAFYEDISKDQHPAGFYQQLKEKYGDLKDSGTYERWATDLVSSTMILDDEKWKRFVEHPTAEAITGDAAFAYYKVFWDNYISKCAAAERQYRERTTSLKHLYMQGLMQMRPGKSWYPDANSSMRLTYGKVQGYRPKDAEERRYFSTMKSAIEKYKPGDAEYDLPEKYIEQYRYRNFAGYEDPASKDIVTCFITTNDISGGNSGSPVLNASGQLIGLAFDENAEGADHLFRFNPQLNRTICVDVRYILWYMTRMGPGPAILKELSLQ